MKKHLDIRTALELPQTGDRRSPVVHGVFSLVLAKPKADRRNAVACEMFSPAYFRAHFTAEDRVTPIGCVYATLGII